MSIRSTELDKLIAQMQRAKCYITSVPMSDSFALVEYEGNMRVATFIGNRSNTLALYLTLRDNPKGWSHV